MTTDAVLGALRAIHDALDELERPHALVGGLAVSVRARPRLTRDVDMAVVVENDADAESLVAALGRRGYLVVVVVERDAVGRLAAARLESPQGVLVDLLFASSGLEPETVARAEPLEIDEGVALPVARTEELLAIKVLSSGARREQDAHDARLFLEIDRDLDLDAVRADLALIRARGYDRGEPLEAKLERIVARATAPSG